MLAASTAGEIVAGVVVLLVAVGLLWLLFRLLTWPFRARRSRPKGLGSDYEQMVRQGRGRTEMTSRPLPFPPPSGEWPTPEPETTAESKIVLPPPPYRARAPEPEPLESMDPPAAVSEPAMPPPSGWQRLMRKTYRFPAWAFMPLAWLGLWFIVSKPLVGAGWVTYGVGLVVAAGLGVWTKRNYHARILWRAERNAVVWQRWGKRDDSLSPPVVVKPTDGSAPLTQPSEETPPAP